MIKKNIKLLAGAMVFCGTATAYAGNYDLGPFKVSPVLSVNETYDSNIYPEEKGNIDALITKLAIGFNADTKLNERSSLKASYLGQSLNYSVNSDDNNAWHDFLQAEYAVTLPRSASLTASETFMNTTDPATSESDTRDKRIQNDLAVKFSAPLKGKFGIDVNINHELNDYRRDAAKNLDRYETKAGFELNYKWQPKTVFLAGYTYGNMNYEKEASSAADANYHNIMLGVKGVLTGKLDYEVRGGVQLRNFSNSVESRNNNPAYFNYDGKIIYTPQQKVRMTLSMEKSTVDTVSYDNGSYEHTLFGLAMNRQFTSRLSAGWNASYTNNRYKISARNDDITALGVNAGYTINSWLKSNCSYTFKHRASNNVESYHDNIVSLGFTGTF